LKPDVCRRVVGRLPSPHTQSCLQKQLWFQQCEMAPPFSFFSCEKKTMVVYLVRSFGLMPESVSHDWHVQPSCQRPNRGPPRRREFSPGGIAVRQNRLSSKLYKHTVRWVSRQSTLPTEFPVDFHNGNSGARGELPAKSRAALDERASRPFPDLPLSSTYAQQYGLPSGQIANFGACLHGRQEIEKRTLAWRSLL